MRSILGSRTLSLLLLLGSGLCAAAADARADVFPAVCAAREIEVITIIEDHGSAGDVSPARLAEAGRAWLRARAVCYQGRVDEAIALYDSIKSLGPAQVGRR